MIILQSIKIRILLFAYFACHAVLALFWPAPGQAIIRLEIKERDERRRWAKGVGR